MKEVYEDEDRRMRDEVSVSVGYRYRYRNEILFILSIVIENIFRYLDRYQESVSISRMSIDKKLDIKDNIDFSIDLSRESRYFISYFILRKNHQNKDNLLSSLPNSLQIHLL